RAAEGTGAAPRRRPIPRCRTRWWRLVSRAPSARETPVLTRDGALPAGRSGRPGAAFRPEPHNVFRLPIARKGNAGRAPVPPRDGALRHRGHDRDLALPRRPPLRSHGELGRLGVPLPAARPGVRGPRGGEPRV